MTRNIDAVLFDYGGVLTLPVRDSIAAWQQADGIDPRSFARVLKAWLSRYAADGTPIHRLETGELSPAEFDVLLAAERVLFVDDAEPNILGARRVGLQGLLHADAGATRAALAALVLDLPVTNGASS